MQYAVDFTRYGFMLIDLTLLHVTAVADCGNFIQASISICFLGQDTFQLFINGTEK
jgi:hypothetical protein